MNGPWRVCHAITRLILGGAQENTVSSVLGLRAMREFDVDLVAGPSTGAEGSIEGSLEKAPGALVRIPTLVRPVRPWNDWLAYRGLLKHFRIRQPHIVHTHSGKAGVLGRLAARRAGAPVIIHTIHGPSFGAFQGAAANAIFRSAERLAGGVTDHFVVVAEAMTRQYLSAGIGAPEKYTRIFSGFDLHPFLEARPEPELAAKFGIKSGDFVVGKVARLFELKGHELLLVGDGPHRSKYEALAESLGIAPSVIFAGLVPPGEVPRYIALMDVLAHLSHREGLARALPQALACGRPGISWDCDGAGEICLDGQTGFLLPMGDLDGLIERMVELERNPSLRRRLANTGQQLVRERFSVETMVRSLADLYIRLLREKNVPPA
jgi:glycosyltransferase involved in cell wall biosynthesis